MVQQTRQNLYKLNLIVADCEADTTEGCLYCDELEPGDAASVNDEPESKVPSDTNTNNQPRSQDFLDTLLDNTLIVHVSITAIGTNESEPQLITSTLSDDEPLAEDFFITGAMLGLPVPKTKAAVLHTPDEK